MKNKTSIPELQLSSLEPHQGMDPWAFISAMTESVLVTDVDLEIPGPTVVFTNPAFERMTGWTHDEILGQSPRLLQGAATDLTAFSGLKEKLRNGEQWNGMATNYRKDGSKFIMEWSIAPVRNLDAVITNFIAVQRDVTARVEAENILQKAQEAVISGLKQRQEIRETFGRFVPNEIADQALANRGALQPDFREATIFFSDIQGFSSLAENMSPKAVIDLLNQYFGLITELVESKNGVIHQFQGDGILATFNLPLNNPNHAADAVDAAVEIRNLLRTHTFAGGIHLKTRYGINTGSVVAGTVGGAGRIGYTVHGDAVNLAARIEQENKRLGTDILVAEATVSKTRKKTSFRYVDTVVLRGRQKPVALYAI
jgi:PAS domain S-box-containing protein